MFTSREDGAQVELFLPDSNRPVRVNIDKESFWDDECRDLINRDIALWLIRTVGERAR
jgi:hypothetical protein